MVPIARLDCSGFFLSSNYSADDAWSEGHTERLLVYTRTVLHTLLGKHYEMEQILSYTEIYTV
jgi:hypothetical protein